MRALAPGPTSSWRATIPVVADEPQPILDQVNVVVRDMDAAVDFYQRLGLSIADTVPEWRAHHRSSHAGIDVDFDSSVFAHTWGVPEGSTGVVLCFRFTARGAVDAKYEELVAAGYRSAQEPWDAHWGARFAMVLDPDGHAVALQSERDPARSRRHDPPRG